jgi:hypothetical protein
MEPVTPNSTVHCGIMTRETANRNSDPTLGDMMNDAHCDGALTANDCDDNDAALGPVFATSHRVVKTALYPSQHAIRAGL